MCGISLLGPGPRGTASHRQATELEPIEQQYPFAAPGRQGENAPLARARDVTSPARIGRESDAMTGQAGARSAIFTDTRSAHTAQRGPRALAGTTAGTTAGTRPGLLAEARRSDGVGLRPLVGQASGRAASSHLSYSRLVLSATGSSPSGGRSSARSQRDERGS